MTRRLVVGVSGATGVVYAVRLLQVLKAVPDVETHLVLSAPARRTLAEETDVSPKDLEECAAAVYDNRDIGAAVASGSFRTAGMALVPCSMKTLSAVAHCYSDTLIARAADVTLKERRPLVAVVRETPLHVGHLKLMVALAEMGGVILPPMPAFYHRPQTVEDIVDHTVARILDHLGVAHALVPEWTGHAVKAGKSAASS